MNNSITRKTIPNFIQEDHYFYFYKTINGSSTSTVDSSNYYSKSYIDDFMSTFQTLMTVFDQRLTLIQASINSIMLVVNINISNNNINGNNLCLYSKLNRLPQ